MRGLAGHPADNDRHQGVMKALAENPGIKLLPNKDGVATGWDPATGTKLITDLINSGGYDDVDGIWTSGIDQQIVDAIKEANKPFVPIVGADLKGFVEMLLNKNGGYDGLKGLAVYNPAAIGGAGVTLALKALDGKPIDSQTKTVKDSQGNDVQIKAIFLPPPEAYDNTTDAGKAKLAEIDVAWPEQPVAGQLVHQRLDRLHHRPDARLQGAGRIASTSGQTATCGRPTTASHTSSRNRRGHMTAIATELVLDATDVSKTFGAVVALKSASLAVRPGEVHALLGANGAGKSTFVKILTGAVRPDSGRIIVRGRERAAHSPGEARRLGLVSVYQEPSVVPDLDLRSNLRLTDTPVDPFRHWLNELG